MRNVSEIVDLQVVSYYQLFTTITIPISLMSTLFYSLVIIKATAKITFLRYSMLTCNSLFMTMEILYFTCKPISLFPFSVLYPVGILSPMAARTCAILTYIFGIILVSYCFILLVVLIVRHYLIVSVINQNAVIQRNFLIGFLVAVFGTLDGLIFAEMFLGFDDRLAHRTLTENVKGIETLLTSQPSLYQIQYKEIYLPFISWGVIAILIGLTCMIWLIYQNYQYSRNNKIVHSEDSRKKFELMFQTTMVQYGVFLFFGIPSLFWALLCFIEPSHLTFFEALTWHYIHLALSLTLPVYPTFDALASILFVKTFRNKAKSLLLMTKRKIKAKVVMTSVSAIAPVT